VGLVDGGIDFAILEPSEGAASAAIGCGEVCGAAGEGSSLPEVVEETPERGDGDVIQAIQSALI